VARWRDIKKGKITPMKNDKNGCNDICSASLMARFKAFITDSFMLLMPLMYIVFYFIFGSREAFSEDKISGWVYIFVPHMVTVVSFWYFKSQTPGMKAYEIEVVDANSGGKASLEKLIARYITMTFFMLLILPMLFPYFNKKKKTLWDVVTKTCTKPLPNDID
jgi:uncharacterized RDD family membrane protein YckC